MQPYHQQHHPQQPGQAPFPQPPYQPYQPQPPYQPHPQQQSFPPRQDPRQYQYPQPAPPPHVSCRVCGGVPALAVTARAHRGMVLLMQFRSLPGPFCRTCGVAAVRSMTTATLAQGWWGPLSFVLFNPFALLWNLVQRFRLGALPPPQQHGPQLDPGEPVLRRPAAYVALLPLALVLFVLAGAVLG